MQPNNSRVNVDPWEEKDEYVVQRRYYLNKKSNFLLYKYYNYFFKNEKKCLNKKTHNINFKNIIYDFS